MRKHSFIDMIAVNTIMTSHTIQYNALQSIYNKLHINITFPTQPPQNQIPISVYTKRLLLGS